MSRGQAHKWISEGQKTIEIKTRTFDDQHLDRVHEMALWLQARRRRGCPAGALPVVCVVHARQLERTEADVMIVSLDRLLAVLRRGADTRAPGVPRKTTDNEQSGWLTSCSESLHARGTRSAHGMMTSRLSSLWSARARSDPQQDAASACSPHCGGYHLTTTMNRRSFRQLRTS